MLLRVAQATLFFCFVSREVRKRRDKVMSKSQEEALKRSTEEKEGEVRKMSLGMEQKASPEKRGETSGRSTEEEERVRKMSSDMEHKEEESPETLERRSYTEEEEEGTRDMPKNKGLEREECLGLLARL